MTWNVADGLVVPIARRHPDSKRDEFMMPVPPVANRVMYHTVPPMILSIVTVPLAHEARPLASDVRTLPRPGDPPEIWMVPARRVFHETERVLWSDVAPVTVRVFLRVEAPTTPRVQPRTVAHETQSVDESVVAHATPRVLWSVEAHATLTVLQRTVAHETQRVDERTVAQVTPRVHWREVFPVARRDPLRSRLEVGLVVQIPTKDPDSNARALVIPEPFAMNLVRYPPLHAEPRTHVA